MIEFTINGKPVSAEPGQSVLEAALAAGVYIPNLCYHPDLKPTGSCRLCVVEIEGAKGLPCACTTKVSEGMAVETDTTAVQELRRDLVWLLMSEQPQPLDENSQLKKVIDYVGMTDALPGFVPEPKDLPALTGEPLFIRDQAKCILCGRCVRMCQDVRGVGAIGFINRGINATVSTSGKSTMQEAACRFCGACVEVCPTGALKDKDPCPEEKREETLLPCSHTCPAGIDIPRYVRLIAEGRFQDALEVIREKVPFPNTLGLVCDHPCERECRRKFVDDGVAVRALKRFVAERDTGRWRSKIKIAPDTGKKVGIIGSGPAGLTAAWFLRKKGHAVTVFESLPEVGGMLRVGIPQYRLADKVLDQEVNDIKAIGVEIRTNAPVDALGALFNEGYDALFVAVGAPVGTTMGIPGEDSPGVLDGISVLRKISLGEDADLKGHVAIVGGGNVAIDVARSALRMGADKVTIVYRRTREEMPAYAEEVEDAEEEGVEIQFLTNPVGISQLNGKLGLECIRMELGEPDESGRRRPVPIVGSEFVMPVDRFLVAIGQRSALPEGFGIIVNRRGRIQVDMEAGDSGLPGVFCGGDAVSGPASVIQAIQAGREGASEIDKYLGGDGVVDDVFIEKEPSSPYLGRDENFGFSPRTELPTIPVEQRLEGFDEVEKGLTEDQAVAQAQRCLRCYLRLEIAKAPLPPA